jgi:hypothetical protein
MQERQPLARSREQYAGAALKFGYYAGGHSHRLETLAFERLAPRDCGKDLLTQARC